MLIVGVDGCKAGWFSITLTENTEWEVGVFPDIFNLWDKYSTASLILIDIPIGLKEGGSEERLCDIEARRLLGHKRASSIFPVPCRSAIHARTYEEACAINERVRGKRLSLQTWNIIPKIREVDNLLSKEKYARNRVRETHPEVCFWAFAGNPMKCNKKTKRGFLERKQVLQSVYPLTNDIITYALSTSKRDKVARDDILDALSAAVTATVGVENLISIPETPEFDSKYLRMEIVYRPYFTGNGLQPDR